MRMQQKETSLILGLLLAGLPLLPPSTKTLLIHVPSLWTIAMTAASESKRGLQDVISVLVLCRRSSTTVTHRTGSGQWP